MLDDRDRAEIRKLVAEEIAKALASHKSEKGPKKTRSKIIYRDSGAGSSCAY